jgi:hypothetical protein
MEFLFEALFQFGGELILQLAFELLVELGFHSVRDTMKRPRNPVLSSIGFILLGTVAGGLSLMILPHSPIANPDLRLANLFVAPILLGVAMVLVGRLRAKKGQNLVRLDRFGYAFVFAFAMALVRFVWAS